MGSWNRCDVSHFGSNATMLQYSASWATWVTWDVIKAPSGLHAGEQPYMKSTADPSQHKACYRSVEVPSVSEGASSKVRVPRRMLSVVTAPLYSLRDLVLVPLLVPHCFTLPISRLPPPSLTRYPCALSLNTLNTCLRS